MTVKKIDISRAGRVFRYGGYWVFRMPGTTLYHYGLTREDATRERARWRY